MNVPSSIVAVVSRLPGARLAVPSIAVGGSAGGVSRIYFFDRLGGSYAVLALVTLAGAGLTLLALVAYRRWRERRR